MKTLLERFPSRKEIQLVLGGVVFAVYTWAMRGFLYKVPSFLLYTSVADIFAIFCYMMAFALLESLAFTFMLILLAALLPGSWLKQGFDHKGFIVVLIFSLASIWLQGILTNQFPSMGLLYGLSGAVCGLVLVLFVLVGRFPVLKKIIFEIQDRMGIMLYVYVPLGILGILIVIFRNIL